MAVLNPGYNVQLTQKLAAGNKPLYPITRTGDVYDAAGDNLDTILASIIGKNFVPDYSEETVSNLRFLRNDNTWATIQDGTTSQKGVVQLSDSTSTDSSATAATSKAVKTVADDLATFTGTTAPATYAALSQIGSSASGSVKGIAELDSNGKVPASQLPSYVDDVVDVGIYPSDLTKAYNSSGAEIDLESAKIYIADLAVTPAGQSEATPVTNKTYRWSGSTLVEISQSLALGETETTAYRGDRGKTAYDHSQSAHARVDATKVEASSTNGNIVVDESELTVYTHPTGASATNPHNTTKADVGLGNVENKDVATIISEITKADITGKLGAATASNDGYMTKEYAAKLDNCAEIAVSGTAPTFTTDGGIWFQIVSTDPEP